MLTKSTGMTNTAHHAVLFALLDMARKDQAATVIRVMQATTLARPEVESLLGMLDRAGLVDSERVRLTLQGLAVAMTLGAPRRARRELKAA